MNRNEESATDRLLRIARSRYVWVCGVALYVAVVWYVGWDEVESALASVRLMLVAAFMVVEGAVLWLRSLKWRIALGPDRQTVGLYFLSKAAGQLTPARVGEFSPLLLAEHRTAKLGAWIGLDRILEASATLGLGAVGLAFALGLSEGATLWYWLVGLLVCFAAILYVLTRQGFIDRVTGRLSPGGLLRRGFEVLGAVSGELRLLGRKVPLLAGLTFLFTAGDLLVGYLLCLSFGYELDVMVLALAHCVHGLTSVIPLTPNATGIPYAASASVLHELAGIPVEVLAGLVAVKLLASNVVFWSSVGVATTMHRTRRSVEATTS